MGTVEPARVIEELENLLGWAGRVQSPHDDADRKRSEYRARLHLTSLRTLLGDDLHAIAAANGDTRTTDYLRELQSELWRNPPDARLLRRWLALLRDTIGSGVVVRIGPGRYRLPDGSVIALPDAQARTLDALILLRAATKSELIAATADEHGIVIEDAHRRLKAIREKYPALAPHIRLPGRKGRGGYSTMILPAD